MPPMARAGMRGGPCADAASRIELPIVAPRRSGKPAERAELHEPGALPRADLLCPFGAGIRRNRPQTTRGLSYCKVLLRLAAGLEAARAEARILKRRLSRAGGSVWPVSRARRGALIQQLFPLFANGIHIDAVILVTLLDQFLLYVSVPGSRLHQARLAKG